MIEALGAKERYILWWKESQRKGNMEGEKEGRAS